MMDVPKVVYVVAKSTFYDYDEEGDPEVHAVLTDLKRADHLAKIVDASVHKVEIDSPDVWPSVLEADAKIFSVDMERDGTVIDVRTVVVGHLREVDTFRFWRRACRDAQGLFYKHNLCGIVIAPTKDAAIDVVDAKRKAFINKQEWPERIMEPT